jgi:8-oxo-dGTP diphosphatase
VSAVGRLSERVHPLTGRTVAYVACHLVDGTAHVAAPDEIAEIAWCDRAALTTRVPYPLFPPVQDHLDSTLP